MQRLAALLAPTDVLVVSDEVYEHMVFDGRVHESLARHAQLAARSLIVSSFGKTFHVTGWKVGYVAAPAPLTAELRKVHQFNVFTVNTPMQHGLAAYMADAKPYLELVVAQLLDGLGVSIREVALSAESVRPGRVGQASSAAGGNDKGNQPSTSAADRLVPIARAGEVRMPCQHSWQAPHYEDRCTGRRTLHTWLSPRPG